MSWFFRIMIKFFTFLLSLVENKRKQQQKELEKQEKQEKRLSAGTLNMMPPINGEYLFKQGMDEVFLYDFTIEAHSGPGGGVGFGGFRAGEAEKRIEITPKAAYEELECVPTPWSLQGLDKKIEILKLKEEIIKNGWAKNEIKGLTLRLENRKKYAEFASFYSQFENTTEARIETLLQKYELVRKPSDLFIADFPDEAIEVMKAYTDKTVELCNKKPVYYVIAPVKMFKTLITKRDPILLVQSPFGFYWQILGAWDEEMLLLSEL